MAASITCSRHINKTAFAKQDRDEFINEREMCFPHHCVKSVRIRSFPGPNFPAFGLNTPYLSVFSPNAGKYGPEKLQLRTLFTQCTLLQIWDGAYL